MKLPYVSPKNKSLILSCAAGIGVIVTGVLSARSSKKADNCDTTKEKLIAYTPAIISGGVTLVCIGASTYISGEEISALTLACAATAQKFANYRAAVRDTVGNDQFEQINETYYQKEIDRLEQELAEREHPTEDDDLCEFIDGYTPYFFKARLEDVEEGIRQALELWKESECLAWCEALFLMNGGDTRPYYSPMGCSGGYWSGDYNFGWSRTLVEDVMGLEDPMDAFDISLVPVKDTPNTYQIKYSIPPEPFYLE